METISRKLVFLFPGFEPLTGRQHANRYRRGLLLTAGTFEVEAQVENAVEAECGAHFVCSTLSGRDWQTVTKTVVCDWSPLIAAYSARSKRQRLGAGVAALADFIRTGTLFRYFRVSWRYALFFLYPVFLLLLVLGLFVVVGSLPFSLEISPAHLAWSIPLGIAAGAGFLIHAERRLHLLTLMDDWAFARDFCRGTSPAIQRWVSDQQALAKRFAANGDWDEILVVGHSLGASLASVVAAPLLARGSFEAPVHVLTVGSSLLKTALHPAASAQRDAVRSIVEDADICWVDVQSVSDVLNFYRSNPAGSLGIRNVREPKVVRISLAQSVGPVSRRRVKRSFFRRHRQFVYGSEKRQAFSFHMILAGPVPFRRYAKVGSVDQIPLRRGSSPAEKEALL